MILLCITCHVRIEKKKGSVSIDECREWLPIVSYSFGFVLSIDLSPFYQVWIVYQWLVLLSFEYVHYLKNSILASTDSPTASNGSTIGTT